MRKNRRTTILLKNIFSPRGLLCSALLVSVLVSTPAATYSAYADSLTGTDDARVARSIVTLEETQLAQGNVMNNQVNSYHFQVSNQDADGNRSEVAMKYRIEAVLTSVTGGNYTGSVSWNLYKAASDSKPALSFTSSTAKGNLSAGQTLVIAEDVRVSLDDAQKDYYWMDFSADTAGEFEIQFRVVAEQEDTRV